MCPFSVASDFWRDFWTSCFVSPGHVERKLFLLRILVWMCMGSTARGGERYTDQLLIWTHINYRQSDAQEFWIPSYFYFVGVLEGPCREMIDCRVFRAWCVFFWLLMMCTFLSPKSARHPLSQNMSIERSALFLRSGKMCACCASMGRVSWGSKAVWEEKMMCPSGMRMPSGFVAIILSTHGLFDFKNFPMFQSLLLQDCINVCLL